MTSVGQQVTLFPGEDETFLKGEYVRLMAKHRRTRSPYEVAKYVFKDLPEPELRSGQAAQIWGSDLEVLEAIDEAVLRGSSSVVDTREARLRTLKQIYDDSAITAKDRIAAIELAAKIEGEIIKQVDSKSTVETNQPALGPIIFKRYEDE